MIPERSVTVLCDNESSRPDIGHEWGLSLAIDLGPGPEGGLWLWDTGKSALFLKNAAALGVDVRAARGLALSHGHYDHTGGLQALRAAGFTGGIHAHPACAGQRWADEGPGKPRREIGPPEPLPAFFPAGEITRLAPGLVMLADIPRLPGRSQCVAGFSRDEAGAVPDNVPDDAFLVLDARSGPVVILGCCHSGLANALACARERLGLGEIHAVLGGMHLYKADEAVLDEAAAALREHGVRLVVAGHCTGQKAAESLRSRLPERDIHDLAAGQTWTF
jgi:7,8-dihydropterin-6-yl-methyl-4-(beta-D-ribofuranosyl)aminobenzene 5'-phosphate synthase